jgi:aminoglycoside phosphotransferase (APT) family kinase protein
MAAESAKIGDATIRGMLRSAGFQSTVNSIRVIADGMLNQVFAVSFDGPPDVVLRVRTFLNPEYGQQFAGERFAYYLIETLGVPVARLHHVEDDARRHGYPFAVFEYVPGLTFDRWHKASETSRTQLYEVLENLAESLGRIHRVRGPGFGILTEIWFGPDDSRGFWGKLFRAEIERLASVDRDESRLYAKAVEAWLEFLDTLSPALRQPRLCHGDIHGRNLLIPGGSQAVLIDWEASRFRTAPYEFAQIRFLNLQHDEDAWNHLLKRYVEASECTLNQEELQHAIDIFRAFWHMRMGLFLRQFPSRESDYFGTAATHIAEACKVVHKTVGKNSRT